MVKAQWFPICKNSGLSTGDVPLHDVLPMFPFQQRRTPPPPCLMLGGYGGSTHWFKQDHCKAYVNLYKARLDGIVEPTAYINL